MTPMNVIYDLAYFPKPLNENFFPKFGKFYKVLAEISNVESDKKAYISSVFTRSTIELLTLITALL